MLQSPSATSAPVAAMLLPQSGPGGAGVSSRAAGASDGGRTHSTRSSTRSRQRRSRATRRRRRTRRPSWPRRCSSLRRSGCGRRRRRCSRTDQQRVLRARRDRSHVRVTALVRPSAGQILGHVDGAPVDDGAGMDAGGLRAARAVSRPGGQSVGGRWGTLTADRQRTSRRRRSVGAIAARTSDEEHGGREKKKKKRSGRIQTGEISA